MAGDTRSLLDRLMEGKPDEDEEDWEELPDEEPDTADEFDKPVSEGVVYRLPGCGKKARLRSVTPLVLAARAGKIVNPMVDEVVRLLAIQTDPLDKMPEAKQVTLYRDNGRAFIYTAKLIIMDPPFIIPELDKREPGKGEIGPGHLKERDYLWLAYTYLQGQAKDLLPFRATNRVRRSSRSGDDLRGQAEPVFGANGEGPEA